SKAELNLSTDALTVDQAIEHALAVYEQNDCNMCGRQHKQLANWLTELLSLREQLAELKALEPFGYIDAVHNWNYTNLKSELNTVAFISKTPDGLIRPDYGMALFTAAKPVAGLGVEDITEFMRKAFWRGFESARGTENSNIPEHWKDSKPNLLLALKAKISGA
ncbi:hypothetical protein ACNHFS_004718, partial [Yersinia enterocolitica]